MKPFVKWVGGKRELLPELLARVPATWNGYHEPFVGGGALFFALSAAAKKPIYATLSDTNAELINTYQVVRGDVKMLIPLLRSYQRKHTNPAFFYKVRDDFNKRRHHMAIGHDVHLAAMFLYLNRAGYNGLMRTNKAGDLNTPRGSYKTIEFDEDNLHQCAEALKTTLLRVEGFAKHPTPLPQPGDLWYADPPYIPIKKGSFVGYGANVFSMSDQETLRDVALELHQRGVHVMLSNSDTPLSRDIYKDFEVAKVSVRRRVNSKGTGRGAVGEIIVTGKPIKQRKTRNKTK